MRSQQIRRGVFAMLLVVTLAPIARAGNYPTVCDRAELTLDGRYVLLRPGCDVNGAFDLATGTLLDAATAEKIAATADVMPLLPHEADGRLGQWMSKTWVVERRGQWEYRWLAFPIPGTDFVLRALRKAGCPDAGDGHLGVCPNATLVGEHQYGSVSAFQDAFSKRQRGPGAPTSLPTVGPFGVSPPADLTKVFTVGPEEKRRRTVADTVGHVVSYDAAAFARLVPTFGDFVHHARYQWRHIGSEATSGWRVDVIPPKSFWASLGMTKPGFRIVVPKDDSRANGELHRIYDALSHGKSLTMMVYEPFWATVLDFVPAEK